VLLTPPGRVALDMGRCPIELVPADEAADVIAAVPDGHPPTEQLAHLARGRRLERPNDGGDRSIGTRRAIAGARRSIGTRHGIRRAELSAAPPRGVALLPPLVERLPPTRPRL
jgi:hypothetical protein